MIIDIVKAVIVWTLLLLYRIPFALVSPVVVAIGLLFQKEMPTDRVPAWDGWKFMQMPKIFWPWDNQRDGNMGDIRGDYPTLQAPKFLNDFWLAWWWLVIRNPVNNISRHVPGINCDLRKHTVELLAGDELVRDRGTTDGWQFCKAGKFYYGFYLVTKPLFGTDTGFRMRVGYKVEPRHNSKDWSADPSKAIKGFTHRFGPNKGYK